MKRSTTLGTLLSLLMIISAILMVACGGGESTSPSSPEADSPAPSAATTIPPTPVPEEGDSLPEFAEYDDPSGVFSIEYPADWTVDDRSRPDTISIFWYPEDQYATASLFLTELTGIADPAAQMHALIDEWMIDASAFATDPDYEELSREDQADGSVLLRFYYTRDGEPTQAGCYFAVHDSFFSALCSVSSEDRWDEQFAVLDHMFDSYVLTLPTTAGPASSYAQYVHPNGVFSIEYPADWTVEDLSTAGQNIFLSFSAQTGTFIFVQLVDVGETLSTQAFNDYINGVLASGFGLAPGYQEASREVQPNGGVLVLFTYQADEDLMNAGTLFEQRGTLFSSLTVGAPAQVFSNHTDDFDHAGNSYTVNETAWPY
jgi:hypothetical protein